MQLCDMVHCHAENGKCPSLNTPTRESSVLQANHYISNYLEYLGELRLVPLLRPKTSVFGQNLISSECSLIALFTPIKFLYSKFVQSSGKFISDYDLIKFIIAFRQHVSTKFHSSFFMRLSSNDFFLCFEQMVSF